MPAKSDEAKERKRQRDRERQRDKRSNPDYQEAEREKDRIRKREERKRDHRRRDYVGEALAHFVDDWEAYNWIDGYIAKRDGNEAYRPWLEALHASDMAKGTVRLCVYETTPLEIEERDGLPRVWQTHRSATIQIPGLPFIKKFKVMDPKDPNPIPIGEGELVRRYLSAQVSGRFIFPKPMYDKVINAPVFFMPQQGTDMLEFDVEYVDISRCYSQLLLRLPTLAVRFNYGKRLFQPVESLPEPSKELLASKHWGRATVGMMRQRMGRCFVYGQPKVFPSRYFHGDTASWVHGILHALASYSIDKCGCFRWHTDGGFFPEGGGAKFSRLLQYLGIDHTLEQFTAVLFASLDQYEAIRPDGSVKQTKLFCSTYMGDFKFSLSENGGSQRNNIIHGLNASWLYSTMEKANV